MIDPHSLKVWLHPCSNFSIVTSLDVGCQMHLHIKGLHHIVTFITFGSNNKDETWVTQINWIGFNQ